VVILGQDPYHQVNQAHGLCFSVNPGIPFPPSLNNIFKELAADMGCALPKSGSLVNWAKQGVFLLNTYLSVEESKPLSHSKIGWELFTDHVLQVLNEQNQAIVFILWGNKAQQKAAFLNNPNHLVLRAPHPSPLSSYQGFFGSKPFSKTNSFLTQNGLEPIAWCL
jgi:uracil-DNA glycosylase